ncbi:hypothetical protein RyT2_20730 [Pseudolactococcus yaeyamensis]
MIFYRLKDSPIQTGIITFDVLPENFDMMSTEEEIIGQIDTLYIESLTDYIGEPFPIVSDDMFEVIQAYQSDVQSRTVSLTYHETGEKFEYWALNPLAIDYLYSETNSTFILEEERIMSEHFFTVADIGTDDWFISLELLESLLRRGFNGFKWEKIEIYNHKV